MAFPGLKYLFIPVFLVSLIPFYKDIRSLSKSVFIDFLRSIWQFLIVGLFMCIGFILTFKILIFPFKETVNFFIFLIFFIQLYFLSDAFHILTNRILNYFIFFSVGISLIALVRFSMSIYGISIYKIPVLGTSLVDDYNFYSLYIFLGFIAVVFNCLSTDKNTYKLENLLLIILFLNIFFSFSRRGEVILILIVTILTILFFISLGKKSYYKYFRKFQVFWLFSLFFLLFFTSYLILPPGIKKYATDAVGLKYSVVKPISNALYYRYFTIFNNELSYEDIEQKFFTLSFNTYDPDTWGTRNHKTIYPLTGENVEIVPSKAKGYLLNNTCNASSWNNNAYAYTLIGNDSVSAGDVINASVYCYVSEDYDGEWVKISAEGAAGGWRSDNYQLSKKGIWQRLSITTSCKEGQVPVYLYISKYGVTDFESMKGHVIFAFPQYRKVTFDPNDPETWGTRKHKVIFPLTGENVEIVPSNARGYMLDSTSNASTWNNNAFAYTLIGNDSVSNGDLVNASVYCYVSEDYDGTWVRLSSEGSIIGNKEAYYDLAKKGTWQKLSLIAACKKGTAPAYLYFSKYGVTDFSSLKGHVIFAFPQYRKINHTDLLISDKDKRLNSIFSINVNFGNLKKMLFEKYQKINDSIDLDKKLKSLQEKKLAGSRFARWYYAWFLFKYEYEWHEKLIGNGFDHLEKFGEKFGEGKYDYPHNPFISAFLYSGIIGGLTYIWFMILAFYYYIKYYKYHLYFLICFLVVFFFSFVSANTHFSIPIYTFLSLIPFLTRYLIEKEKSEKSVEN